MALVPAHDGHSPASDRLVGLMRDAVERTPVDHPKRAARLSELGVALVERFVQTGQPNYLSGAIEVARAAVDAAPLGNPGRAACLCNLGMHLLTRFELAGHAEDLAEAISTSRGAVDAAPPGHPKRGRYLSNLCSVIKVRFDRTGDQADLTEAIEIGRCAEQATPAGPYRAKPLCNLCVALRVRSELNDSPTDLAESIRMGHAAADLTRTGELDHWIALSALGNAELARFERTGNLADGAESIAHLRGAAAEAPAYHPGRARVMSNLSHALLAEFGQSGELASVTGAIETSRATVAAASLGESDRARYLSNLGGALRARFELTGELADLNEAIDALRHALAIGANHPERVTFVHNLGVLLHARFTRTKEPADLNEAIGAARAIVRVAAADDPNRAAYQCVLGVDLWQRFQEEGNPADLREAIVAGRAAVQASRADHPDRAMFLHDLCNMLLTRVVSGSGRDGSPAELTEVIARAREAAGAVRAEHPNRVGYLFTLGTALWTRSLASGQEQDTADALTAWREAAEIQSGPASRRLGVAQAWGKFAAERGMAHEAEAGFAAAVRLLPLQAWPGLRHTTRQESLAGRAGLASDAAASAINAGHPEHAVLLLEHGRAVLWSQALNLRRDLDDLRRAHPDLAYRLDAARAILDRPDESRYQQLPGSADSAAAAQDKRRTTALRHRDEARLRAANSWDEHVAEVRDLPGFASFLHPPALAELISDMNPGTVVIINVSRYRCDALCVSPAGVRVIPLPGLALDVTANQADRFRQALTRLGQPASVQLGGDLADSGDARKGSAHSVIVHVLEWLWDTIAGPVLEGLGHTAAPAADLGLWPRVWWCPTGPLTMLPIHAAGHHAASRPGLAVHDRVISSYTPTLGFLHRARLTADHRPEPRMLLVTMPTTPYLPRGAPLPGVSREADLVAERFPLALTRRTGKSATREAILSSLPTHAYAHFACHGAINPGQPAESGLCLEDGRLTIESISRRGLPPESGQLAFLSACHSSFASPDLPDEAITVAAAMQLAGFRHVIATMWAIADVTAPHVADDFYQMVTRDSQGAGDAELPAAQALHAAVSRLRSAGHHPARWAPYIHAGP